ncbi:MAG: TonB-dependent siderophore receptor [Cyanobacteria bacterium P01_E01_bin.6]
MAKVVSGFNRVLLMAIAISTAELMINSQVAGAEEIAGLHADIALAEQSQHDPITARGFESSVDPEVTLLSEVDRPATTITDWMAQIAQQTAATVTITDIQLIPTDAGVDVLLMTESGTFSSPEIQQVGNALIAEIPNAVLDISGDDAFQQFDPVEGIVLIEALTVDQQTVRLTITGTDAPPVVSAGSGAENLMFSVAAGDPATATVDDETIQVVVTGEQDGYVVPNANTATRTDTPLRDIPQSIQVIPQAILEDQQVLRLNDALRNVSGAVQASGDPRGQRFILRGFESASVLRDGFRLTNGANGNVGFQELSQIEQIEVLKGPAAILFGAIEPGGVINLVSERPSREPFYDLSFRLGNRDLVEPSIDISGPLTDDGSVLYRLNALYRNEESLRDFDTDIERVFIAPTVSFAIGDRTDLTFQLEYLEEDRPADFGLVAVGDEVADIPFDQILGEPGDINRTDSLLASYQFEHRFNDSWKVRNSFSYNQFDTEFISAFPFGGVDEATGILFRNFILLDQPTDSFELQADVVGEFSTGPIDHTLLFGVDLFRIEFNNNIGRADFFSPTPINIFDPVFGGTPAPDFDEAPILFEGISDQTDLLGIFVQDQITLLDNLKLLVGVRFDAFEQEVVTGPSFFTPEGIDTRTTGDAFSPRVGLVYQPIEPVSLFASFSRSFSPNTATTISGDIIDPERGEQFEVGVKSELLDGRFSASLAYFNITLENVATPDPDFPTFSVATGRQRSQGIEIDLIGELLPGWNFLANYALTDADITEDNTDIEGNRLFSVPRNNFNLWTTYDIQGGLLEGLGFGIGFNFVGERFGDNANSFTLGSYFLTNAAISYERDNWRLGLNIRNLFDVDFIESASNSRTTEIDPGEDFTIIGSVAVSF